MAVIDIEFIDGIVHFIVDSNIDTSWVFVDYGYVRMRACEYCGSVEAVTYGPDPFDYDVRDDPTPHFLCADCRDSRADDI